MKFRISFEYNRVLHAMMVGGFLFYGNISLASAAAVDGVFRGNYQCPAGLQGVILSFTSNSANKLRVVWSFFDVPGGFVSPTGIAEFKGTYTPSNRRVVVNPPLPWVAQPPGYVAIGFSGTLSADGKRITGTMSGASCTTISVTRLKVIP